MFKILMFLIKIYHNWFVLYIIFHQMQLLSDGKNFI